MSLGQAMLDAAHGAMLGEAIGQANAFADEANRRAHEWMHYARNLEAKVEFLEGKVRNLAAQNSNLTNEIQNREGVRRYLAAELKLSRDSNSANSKLAAYRKQSVEALYQALRCSSSKAEALKVLLEHHREVVVRLQLIDQLPQDLEHKAEEAAREFLNGRQLTRDPEVHAILKNMLPEGARPA